MEPIYTQSFTITDNCVDRYGRMKTAYMLYCVQEVAGRHVDVISMDYDALASRGMIWVITRQRLQITRLPRRGETIRLETWPMPTTRVAYPRSVVAFDSSGNEVFRSISIWVLMDINSRSLILPGNSGISVAGTLRGGELSAPGSLTPKVLTNHRSRTVRFTDLDRNGHMNNTRYMDWIDDLLPSPFHESHSPRELTVCYLSETREGQNLDLHWDVFPDGTLQVDAHRARENGEGTERVFAAKVQF